MKEDRVNTEYDPFDPQIASDPFPHYERMRQNTPVQYWKKANVWTVSTYNEVSEVLKDTENFSSRAMSELLMGKLPGRHPMSADAVDQQPTRKELQGLLIAADPPIHTQLRGVVNRGFLPTMIKSLETVAETSAEALLKEIEGKQDFDIVRDFSAKITVIMIAKLMGVKDEFHPNIRVWAETITRGMNGSSRHLGAMKSGALSASKSLYAVIAQTIQEKMIEPDDGLVNRMTQATGDNSLTPLEATKFGGLLLFAGAETTTNLIGNAIHAMLQHPGLFDRVCDQPELIPDLLEETVRWNGPVQYVFRRVVNDTTVAGTTIPKGADVCVLLGSANRDASKWGGDAEEFKIERKTAGHVGFGKGIHYCVGGPLARMEARIAMEKLLPIIRNAKPKTTKFQLIDSTQFRGFRSIVFSHENCVF